MTTKTEQELIDEALECFDKDDAELLKIYEKARAKLWEALEKRLEEIEAME